MTDQGGEVDIVGRAIAILEEEVRRWAQQRGLPAPDEPVSPSDEGNRNGAGR